MTQEEDYFYFYSQYFGVLRTVGWYGWITSSIQVSLLLVFLVSIEVTTSINL